MIKEVSDDDRLKLLIITGAGKAFCAMANLAIVPREYAFEFLLFCNQNPRPCPVLDVTEPGSSHPLMLTPEADLRADLPLQGWRTYRGTYGYY